MTAATLTSKGQITIPKAVRDSLRLRTGDKVVFVVRETGEAVLTPVTRTVDQVFGRMHAPGAPRRTVEEMRESVAGRWKGRRG